MDRQTRNLQNLKAGKIEVTETIPPKDALREGEMRIVAPSGQRPRLYAKIRNQLYMGYFFKPDVEPGTASGLRPVVPDSENSVKGFHILNADSVQLDAGTSSLAPLIFTAGTNLTTPIAGATEFNGKSLFFTPASERRSIDLSDGVVTSDTTVANTTTETTVYTEPIAADELHEDLMLRFKASGHYDTASASDFFTARLKLGGTTIDTLTGAAANITNGAWSVEFTTTVRSTGASGTVIGSALGIFEEELVHDANTSATTIDTTAAANLTLTIQWDAADAGNTLTITQGLTHFLN